MNKDCIKKQLENKNKECRMYERTLCEIEKVIKTLWIDGCSYGDYNCNECAPSDDGTSCNVRIKQKILSAIRKTRK